VRLASSASNGTITFDRAFAPYGEMYNNVIGGTGQTDFTGLTRDTVSDENDTTARKLHPGQSRWISPDPAGMSVVNPADPQTWNRYGYVRNSPLTATDRSGLMMRVQGSDCGCGGLMGDDASALANAILATQAWGEPPGEILFTEVGFGGSPDASVMFNSPVAQQSCLGGYCMVGSYNFATANADGTWTVDWQAQKNAEIADALTVFYEQAQAVADQLGISLDELLAAQNLDSSSALQPFLKGGNWNFLVPEDVPNPDCPSDRCGSFPSLHFPPDESGNDLVTGNPYFYVHLDTANPYNWTFFPEGFITHGVVDVFLGNTLFAPGIPRFP